MRLVAYNIRYATGTGPAFHLPLPGAGYLRSSPQVLEKITAFLKARNPDIIGLIEVDMGSIRTGMVKARMRSAMNGSAPLSTLTSVTSGGQSSRPMSPLPAPTSHSASQPSA